MQKFGKAQTLGRIEDLRFLTGAGRYVDDIAPRSALHAVFVRSTLSHAKIDLLDISGAQSAPGVHLVLTADALLEQGVTLGMHGTTVTNKDGSKGKAPIRPVLGHGTLRYVGEPIAMIVADTLAQAMDAAEMVDIETTDLEVKLDLTVGGAAIHDCAPGNLAYDYRLGDAERVSDQLSQSEHRVGLEVFHNRIIVNSMEARTAFAEWDGQKLHFCVNGQGVWVQKGELARMLHLLPDQVRVTNPDVGGGFGMKGMTYPEYVSIAQAARLLARPVRWASERTEAMLSDNAGRDLIAHVEMGFDKYFKITSYHVDIKSNLGAYNSQFAQPIQSDLFAKVVSGVYDIQDVLLTVRGIYTNTTPVDAYRGAGRPEAILTIEQSMDHAARVLGLDPVDLRRRNFIRDYPYKMMNGETITVGDFDRVLNRLIVEADVDGFAARKEASRAKGLIRGQGLACYVEAILGSPLETARVDFEESGKVALYVGTQSNGQGHETVYAQLLSAQTGIDESLIRIVQGDSDLIPNGGGTGGSRSVTVQGTAITSVAHHIQAELAQFLVNDLGPDVTFAEGRFGAPGSNLRLTMIEAADKARAAGREDLLTHSQTIRLEGRSFPNGAHMAEVEIDPETGALRLDRYIVTDDFGVLLNPQFVEGQVHGGIAQGFGQAVTETAIYDEQGQLLTASFMDYAMPRADDLPMIKFTTEPVPSPHNPLGMKGCGEAGTVGSLGAISNAVADALASVGAAPIDMPFTPVRLWTTLREASLGRDIN